MEYVFSWSEDGNSIYYDVLGAPTDGGNLIDTFVMALDGSGSSPVDWKRIPSYHYPSRSPDGTKEAVVVLREKGDEENLARLQITNVGEDEPSVIPLPSLPQNATVSDQTWITLPTWAPDSMRMAFASLSHRFRSFGPLI